MKKEKFECTKEIIRSRKSKNKGEKEKDKRSNNDIQNTTKKT
jgi:hypothetical protein